MYRKLSRLSFLYTADNVFLLRRRSGFPFLLSELLPGVGQHQLDAVLLIDRRSRGVIINGHDVGIGIIVLQRTDHTFAHDVVGQASEGLRAHDVGNAFVDQ